MKTTIVVFFEKTIVYMLGKFWDGQNLAICGQNLAIFRSKLAVLKVFGLLALAEGPMDSRSCVRASVRVSVRVSVTRYLEIRISDFSETWHKVASWRD